ncbi:MAG: hypothetical protein L0Y56_17610, partial [Nitrospira sp.]|nr:hypothetical protein [Nitrospira sp.]
DNIAGLILTGNPIFQTLQAADTGLATPAAVTILADVFDEVGQRASAGVRVEFFTDIGAIVPFDETSEAGQAQSLLAFPALPVGRTIATITGRVVINGRVFLDTLTVVVDVLPPATPAPTATPVPATPTPTPPGGPTPVPTATPPPGATATPTVTPTPGPTPAITLTLSPDTVSVGSTFTLTARVVTNAGPVAGVTVQFTRSDNCSGAVFTPPVEFILRGPTDSNGIVIQDFTVVSANVRPCTAIFTASSSIGGSSNSVSLTIQ